MNQLGFNCYVSLNQVIELAQHSPARSDSVLRALFEGVSWADGHVTIRLHVTIKSIDVKPGD